MRTFPVYAAPSGELLWWDALIDASQGWGHRLKKGVWESLERAIHSVKNDATSCKKAQGLAGANYFVDDEGGKILSTASDATCTASAEKSRRLFPEAQVSLRNIFGFARAFVQEGSLKSGAGSNISGSSISVGVYSRNGAREDCQYSSFGKWVSRDAICGQQASLGDGSLAVKLYEKVQEKVVQPNKVSLLTMLIDCSNGLSFCTLDQDSALYNQNKSVIEAASILESVFTEICAMHGVSVEESFVIDNNHRQKSLMMDGAGIVRKKNRYLGGLFDKLSSVTLFSWLEQVGSKPHGNIYLSTFNPFDGIDLVKLGMLLQKHVNNDRKANACFQSALADLYSEGGMPMDASIVLKSLESTLAAPFRALIEGCDLPGEGSKYMEEEGEQSNGSNNFGLLPWNCEGHFKGKGCAFTGLKHFVTRGNLPWSSACMKEINGLGRPMGSIDFRRAMSTSTEKECDEDIGEQQSSNQQHSSSQQQSSLELSDSKPRGTSSWPNPDNAASYVLMSNIYADGDRWDEVKRINEMRLKARAWKKPGKAYVEIKAKVHEFIVGDRTHQDSVNIYEKLRKIKRHMGHIGYVPNVDLILENRSYYDPYKPR